MILRAGARIGRLLAVSCAAIAGPAEELAAFVASDYEKRSRVIKPANIKAQ